MSEMEDMIREHAARIAAEQKELVEIDLLRVFGSLRRARRKLKADGRYEIVWQKAPNGAVIADYRGILRRGKWLVDRFPDWPTPVTRRNLTE